MSVYRFYLLSSKISDLLAAGIERDRIEPRRAGVVRFGNKAYPRILYEATVDRVNVVERNYAWFVDDRIHELETKYKQTVHVEYVEGRKIG